MVRCGKWILDVSITPCLVAFIAVGSLYEKRLAVRLAAAFPHLGQDRSHVPTSRP
jgi:hypothetical protein